MCADFLLSWDTSGRSRQPPGAGHKALYQLPAHRGSQLGYCDVVVVVPGHIVLKPEVHPVDVFLGVCRGRDEGRHSWSIFQLTDQWGGGVTFLKWGTQQSATLKKKPDIHLQHIKNKLGTFGKNWSKFGLWQNKHPLKRQKKKYPSKFCKPRGKM